MGTQFSYLLQRKIICKLVDHLKANKFGNATSPTPFSWPLPWCYSLVSLAKVADKKFFIQSNSLINQSVYTCNICANRNHVDFYGDVSDEKGCTSANTRRKVFLASTRLSREHSNIWANVFKTIDLCYETKLWNLNRLALSHILGVQGKSSSPNIITEWKTHCTQRSAES